MKPTPIRSGATTTAPDIDELLTIEQAAQRINMSARYVRRLVAEREIPVYRFGRSVRINPDDLAGFMASSRIEPITSTSVRADLRRVA